MAQSRNLSSAYVDSLIGEPERKDLEFKSGLDGSKGSADPWYVGQSRISDRAKYSLFREIVGFANRNGGTLVLGINEDEDHPHCAASLNPIPSVHELADRLRRSAHGCIEPPVYSLDVEGIETQANGYGVVVFRVGASSLAPHRVNMKDFPKDCFIRRNDETVPMDMRSIQDLVLDRAAFGKTVAELFNDRKASFQIFAERSEQQFEANLHPKDGRVAHPRRCGGMRVTAIPMHRVNVPNITLRDDFKLAFHNIQEAATERFLAYPHQATPSDYRPVLRGWKARSGRTSWAFERCVLSTGLIEDRFVACPHDWNRDHHLYFEWMLCAFVNVLLGIYDFRTRTRQPIIEYAVEFELRLPNVWTLRLGRMLDFGEHGFKPDSENVTFERFPVGDQKSFPALINQFQHDLWNCVGLQNQTPIEIGNLP